MCQGGSHLDDEAQGEGFHGGAADVVGAEDDEQSNRQRHDSAEGIDKETQPPHGKVKEQEVVGIHVRELLKAATHTHRSAKEARSKDTCCRVG